MPVQLTLNVVTLLLCIVTLTMASAALMPQIKQGLVMLRDGFLWAILFGTLGLVGVIGWARLHDIRQGRLDTSESTATQQVGQPVDRLPDRIVTRVEASNSDLVADYSITTSESWRKTPAAEVRTLRPVQQSAVTVR